MARPLRPLLANGVYHVTTRGNERADIYADDHDRAAFGRVLGRTIDRFDWRCLTYCLMGNHFHLLVRTPQPNLSRGMQSLKSTYAQAYNRRPERVGHLFAGRFSAVLIQRDSHLLEVFRYIALNPVRAHLCDHAGGWKWSGHAALQSGVAAEPWHAVEEALGYFAGETSGPGAAAYMDFVNSEGSGRYPPRGVVFGDEDFKRSVLPDRRIDAEIPLRDWSEGRPSLDQIFDGSHPRDRVTMAYCTHGYSMPEIATYLGRHVSTVSRLLRDARERNL